MDAGDLDRLRLCFADIKECIQLLGAERGGDEAKRKLWATQVSTKLTELKLPLSGWQQNVALAKLRAEQCSFEESDRGQALAELEAVKDEGDELIVRLLALLARGPPLLRPEVIGSLEQALCPPLARALDGDRASLAGLIKREGAGVFTIDVFSEPWMQQLITEADELALFANMLKGRGLVQGSSSFYSQSRFSSPYSVNKPGLEGVIFNNFPHTKALMHSLVKRVIEPVGVAYLEREDKKPKKHRWIEPQYAHVVSYSMMMYNQPRGHFPHVDDSELTINICLGKQFEGGHLTVVDDEGNEVTLPQVPGRAIVHNGRALHSSKDITSGERYNLIVWCRFHESPFDTFPFEELPPELQQAVVDLLPPEDLCRLRLASQDMYGFVEGSNRWQWEAAQSQFVRDSPDDKRSWRQVFMDTSAKHRANRLKGMSPLAPLVATRFRGPPTETPLGLPYSTLYGGGHPFPMKMAMPAPIWGMPGSVYPQPLPWTAPPGFGPAPGSLPVPWAQPTPMLMQPPMTRMAAPPQPQPFGMPPLMGMIPPPMPFLSPPMGPPPGMALPRPVMPPLGMPPTRMAQPPPATLPPPLQPGCQPSQGVVQKGGCQLQ